MACPPRLFGPCVEANDLGIGKCPRFEAGSLRARSVSEGGVNDLSIHWRRYAMSSFRAIYDCIAYGA